MLVYSLTTQHKLIILCKWLIEVEVETKVIHRFVYTIRYPILMLHLLTSKPILRLVDGIHLCSLCKDTDTNVVVTHRARAFIALKAIVTELYITIDGRLEGWFLRDDIDGTSYCTTSIQGRACALYNLKSVNIIRSHLLKTIYSCKSRVYWFTINKHLRVLCTKPLHTYLREVTELTLLFYADSWYTF